MAINYFLLMIMYLKFRYMKQCISYNHSMGWLILGYICTVDATITTEFSI